MNNMTVDHMISLRYRHNHTQHYTHKTMMVSIPVSVSLCRNSLAVPTTSCIRSLGGHSKTFLCVMKADWEILAWRVVRPVGCTVKLLEMTLETAYGCEMNIHLWVTVLLNIAAVSMTTARSLFNLHPDMPHLSGTRWW